MVGNVNFSNVDHARSDRCNPFIRTLYGPHYTNTCLRAVCSGHSLSSNRVIGHPRIYQWRACTRIRLRTRGMHLNMYILQLHVRYLTSHSFIELVNFYLLNVTITFSLCNNYLVLARCIVHVYELSI